MRERSAAQRGKRGRGTMRSEGKEWREGAEWKRHMRSEVRRLNSGQGARREAGGGKALATSRAWEQGCAADDRVTANHDARSCSLYLILATLLLTGHATSPSHGRRGGR